MFGGPILAHHAGQPHRGEVAGGIGEEDGRAAQDVSRFWVGVSTLSRATDPTTTNGITHILLDEETRLG